MVLPIVCFMLFGQAAQAATSYRVVHHAAWNAAGEVWYNSSNHNLSVGYNSFTIKDSMCNDGWGIRVAYWFRGEEWRWTAPVTCDKGGLPEQTFSIPSRGQRTAVSWNGCKYNIALPSWVECYPADSAADQVGPADNSCSSAWILRANGLVDGYFHRWAVTIRPTNAARPPSTVSVNELWRDLRNCVPFPFDVTSNERLSLWQQMWCHRVYGAWRPGGWFGGETWDLESARRPLADWELGAVSFANQCNW
jgi:hypothetical protein